MFFDFDDEVLVLVNNIKYGFVVYIWMNDFKCVYNFVQFVEVGMVWLNSNNVCDLCMLFGGVKVLGFGYEGGYCFIDFYIDQQSVYIMFVLILYNLIFGKV